MNSGGFSEFFSQPKYTVGKRAMEHIPVELDSYDAKRPMVITNKAITRAGLAKKFIKALYDSNITIGAMFDDAPPYVTLDLVERLKGLYRWRECDSIIGVGGASVMDAAKALNIALSTDNGFSGGIDSVKIDSPMSPMFYAAAMIYDGYEASASVKIEGRVINSHFLYPDLVCIDNTMAAPRRAVEQFIYAAVEALTACVEGAADSLGNAMIDTSAYAGIQLIAENLTRVYKKPSDKKASLAVANGMAVAGSVRSNSSGGMAVLAAEVLSAETGHPAGKIAGILLPRALKFKLKKKIAVREDLLLAISGIDRFCMTPKNERQSAAVEALSALFAPLGILIPPSLKYLRVQEHLIEKTAVKVEELSGKKLSRGDCAEFLRAAWEGK